MILIDNHGCTDPYFNLALEEFLIRNLECADEDYLLLYVNEPCIILGKNQSIYKEVNFDFLRNEKLKLARRITGGGTVYHDHGNLNFSIISKFAEHKINNYRYFNQPVINALGKAGIEASMDSRNNIICRGKKISGSAQFTNRKNMISHGTLLLGANLDTLRASLKPNSFKIETKAVSSVSSSVMNINELSNRFATANDLKRFLIHELHADKLFLLSADDQQQVEALSSGKFKSLDWIYCRSPLTKIEKEGIIIVVDEGKIISVAGSVQLPDLIGVQYEYMSIKKALGDIPNASLLLSAIF